MKFFVYGLIALAVMVSCVTETEAACGGLGSRVGRVLGVQRRQERRASGNGAFQGRRYGSGACASGACR